MTTQRSTVVDQARDPCARLKEWRMCRIRELAYLKAERRGFAPGHEVEDWCEAEQEVDEELRPLPKH
jgi:hypothetical protein